MHHFLGLLENPGLLGKHTVQITGELTAFEQLSVPTQPYHMAFDVLQFEVKF